MNLLQWHGPAVKKLLGWKQGDEEEKWAERAIDSLVKKLKKKKKGDGEGTVEDLEWALANPSSTSRCVTIPRSLDGRLQVSHKKGLPHVIYCKVWRWPDLHSHQELRAAPECQYPFEGQRTHICINPYHYHRVETTPRVLSSSSSSASQSPPLNQFHFSHPPIDVPGSSSSYQTPSPPNYQSSASSRCSVSPPYPGLYGPSPQMTYSNGGSPVGFLAHSPALSDDDECRPTISPLENLWPPPPFWATINYYELNTRVGEQFRVYHPEITVDGFTDPSQDDRICLGLLTNVNRNTTIENTRKHIGKGIRLTYSSDTNLSVTNYSTSAIFVQSRLCNWKMNLRPQAVLRVPPTVSTVIFDKQIFASMLHNARQGGYENLYDLQKMCFIRISFVKGWGEDYPRQDITSTPCWIELTMHTPLAWIDQYLQTAGKPNAKVTSFS
ncbi:unnamed protein product, partial [Mesorhabditis belari]|uniref:Mothers against decapentaplegic homolog n=1 Tax=Mesorhabditis belari TaxID=2138241 RepID=A0AAF3EAS2_9BILA